MFSEGFEQWMRMNKNAALPIHEFNKTLTETCTHLMQQNAELTSENLALLSSQLKRLSTVKRPEEFFSLQREFLNENISASMNTMQTILKISMENMEKFTRSIAPLTDFASDVAASTHAATTGKRHPEKEKTER